MSDFNNRVLECALEYIKLGWKVLPLHTIRNGQCACGKSNCSSPGKHPITANGVKDASSEPDVIKRWFDNGIPFNIGIATGTASGLVVLDIDPKNGGDESIKQFDIPPTLEVTTGSGGKHYYFALPAGEEIRNSAGKIAVGLDVRGENGYVVAPPSVHASGNDYRWAVDPRGVQLAALPAWMRKSSQQPASSNQQKDNDAIHEGQRNERLTSIAGSMRRAGKNAQTIYAALIEINQKRCCPPLGFAELNQIAQSVAQYPAGQVDGIILDNDHPDVIARAFEDWSKVKHRHYIETWTVVEDKKYRIVDERELRKWVRRFGAQCRVRRHVRTDEGNVIRIERLKVTPHLVKSVLESLSALDDVWILSEYAPPSWLDDRKHPDPENVIALQNCMIDITGKAPKVLELTEEFFTVNYLPFNYDPKAECPLWLEKLAQWFQIDRLSSAKTEWDPQADDFVEVYEKVPDELSISILSEWFGYCLTQQTQYQKILGLVGPKRSGKGTIGRILRELAGKDNVASPTLSSLTNEHGLQSLYNKTLAIIGDAAISGNNADTVRAVERLKSISGEDSQQINPKGKAYIEVPKLNVRFTIMSNELQKLTDPTGALAGRFIYLITTQSFYGKEDVELESKLLNELPGIFNWALEGLLRLKARGGFCESEAGKEAKAMAEELGSPIIAFVREWCEVKAGRQTSCADLYEAYKRWSEEAGRGQMGRNKFYADFCSTYQGCKRVRSRVNSVSASVSNPVYVFDGVRLMDEHLLGL